MSIEGKGLRLGDWYAICDVCGRRFFGSTLLLRWDNLRVCTDDWEPRHPQDFVRAIKENRNVPFSRPAQLAANEVAEFEPFNSATTSPWATPE